MADNRYVDDNTPGASSPFNGGWSTAAATLAAVDGVDTAGDSIFIANTHNEGVTGNITFAFAGTIADPTKIYSTAASGTPPTAVSAGAAIDTSGTGTGTTMTFQGNLYMEGVTVAAGTTTGNGSITLGQAANVRQVYKNCKFQCNGTNSAARLSIGTPSTGNVNSFELHDCELKFAHASQGISIAGCDVLFRNLSYNASNVAGQDRVVTTLSTSLRASKVLFEGCNFTNCAADVSLLPTPVAGYGSGNSVIFRNCALPSSWAGTLCGTAAAGVAPGQRFEMHNCASGDANFEMWIEDYLGTILAEDTLYRDSGASDGTTTGLSWKMTSNADVEYPTNVLYSPEFVIWNSTTGTAKTITVEIVHESQGSGTNGVLKNDEIWLEVQYQGTSGKPQTVSLTTEKADPLGSNADVATSSATWTGDAAGWDQQKLVTGSFTPTEIGYIHCRVCVAKPSITVYVDPKITIANA